MQFIFDHLTAIVPGAIILLLLGMLHVRNQDDNIDAFRSETNRARMLDLVQVVERDLRNAGSGVGQAGLFSWSTDTPQVGNPSILFDFVTAIDTSLTAQPVRIMYQLAVADSTVIDGAMVPLYELRRLQVTEIDTVQLSRTPPVLTSFEVSLLNSTGANTTDLAAARGLAVTATSISPFGRDRTTRDSRWTTVMWPVNLREVPLPGS